MQGRVFQNPSMIINDKNDLLIIDCTKISKSQSRNMHFPVYCNRAG